MELTKEETFFLQKVGNEIKSILKNEAPKIAKSYYENNFLIDQKIGKDKRDYLDMVTEIDKSVEEVVFHQLHEKFPELGFEMEEHKEWEIPNKDFMCFIDPIDGTKYFANHIPIFSSQIGILFKGEPILGACMNPITNELYFGSEIEKTNRDGIELKVSMKNKLEETIINIGIVPFRPNWDDQKDWVFKKLDDFEKACYRIRQIGSSALVLSWVAQGGLDASVYLVNDPDYDTVAGRALIKYAGGKTEKVFIPKVNDTRLICSNNSLFEEIKRLLLK